MFLKITNHGTTPFTSKFNGMEYMFAPNQPTIIGADAAQHIFGVGLADKTEVLTRHGLLTHSSGMANAMAWLDLFSFDIPNDNPESEPLVEFPPLPEIEDDKGQGSAPLQFGTGSDGSVPDGAVSDESAPISEPDGEVKGGSILDNITSFLHLKP